MFTPNEPPTSESNGKVRAAFRKIARVMDSLDHAEQLRILAALNALLGPDR